MVTCNIYQSAGTERLDGDAMYISLVASPLQAKIMGGTVRTFQRGTIVNLDAVTKSYDPDTEDRADKAGMTFSWKCAKKMAASEDTTSIDCETVMTSESAAAAGVIVVNTRNLATGDFVFSVTLAKDTRTVTTRQTLQIVDGLVPNVTVT